MPQPVPGSKACRRAPAFEPQVPVPEGVLELPQHLHASQPMPDELAMYAELALWRVRRIQDEVVGTCERLLGAPPAFIWLLSVPELAARLANNAVDPA